VPTALDIALSIASQGFPVFPCARNKQPAISKERGGRGFLDASTDPERIKVMFGQAGDLVGSPTGEITGFDVLDLDYRHRAQDWESANTHRLPETRIHQTQSGGRHYLFRHAPGVRNSAGRIAQGVDVRGDGGYVVMPPSLGYGIINDSDIAEWPDWLLELALPPPEPPRRPVAHPAVSVESKRYDGFIRGVADRVGRAADGAKHFALRNAALSLGGIQDAAGLSDDAATQLLLAALPPGVKDWKAAAKTIAWGLERGRAKPIELPDRPLNGHHHQEAAPATPQDPGWWHSLEARLGEEPAEVDDAETTTSVEPPQDDPDAQIINPPRDWTAPAPLREWIVDGWIPRGYATGLYGDGGVGKSLLAQQLLSSVALGLPWLGLTVKGGRAFGMMCEDDRHELHRRQESINRAYQVGMQHLENLRLAPRLGFDNLLMTFDQSNHPHLTPLFADLCRMLDAFPPTLVVLDTLADIFGGNEIARVHARLFVQGVGGQIARRWNCGVVIAGHPSAAGLATGAGTSGNTAWNNTFRSRLYVTRPEDDPTGDTRLISRMKANYAPKGGEITFRWQEGAFLAEDGTQPARARRIEWDQIDAIFREIARAWDADEPWSSVPQTRKHGRYLPLWAQIHLGLPERLVAQQVENWLAGGFLRSEVYDKRTKAIGLRVIRRLQPPVAAEVVRRSEK